MATKGALSSLPKLTPAYGLEEGEKDDAVERATQRVMQAYSARQNLGYDPTLMAFSQGMLSSRGNFAEGLGAGLKGAQEAQQRTRDLDVEEAQAGLTMAQAQRDQQNAQRAASAFRQITGSAPASPTGLPTNGVSSTPATNKPTGQQGNAPAGMQPITVEMAKNFMDAFPLDKDRGKFLMEAAKLYQGRFLMNDQGVFDTMANGGRGAFVDLPMRNQKPYEYPTVGGTLAMTPGEYDKYKMAVSKGLGKQWVEAYKAGESTDLVEEIASGKKGIMSLPAPKEVMESQVSNKPKVEGPAAVAEPVSIEKKADAPQDKVSAMLSKPPNPKGILSKEEMDAAQAQRNLDKEIALKEAESGIRLEEETKKTQQAEDLARKAEVRTKADVGRTTRNFARQFRTISEDPSADKILGAFSNNNVFSAIVNLAESGAGTKDFRIGIPELSPILRNLNLDPKEMQKAQVMGMLIAQMQLSKGKMISGNTSNYDLALMGQSGVTDKDTKLTVRAKADMIERQAQYHEELEEMLEDWKGTMSAFNRSKKVQEATNKFNIDLIDIINGKLKYSNPAKDAKPAPAKAAPSGDKKPAGKKIDSEDALKKLLGGDK